MSVNKRKEISFSVIFFLIVFCDHIEDYSRDNQQQARHHQHDGADERGKMLDRAGLPELDRHSHAQRQSHKTDDGADSSEERQRLVFANHAENRRQHPDAVAHCVQLAHRPLRPVPVLNRHLVELQVVVHAVDRHLGLDLEAGGQHWIGLREDERKRPVAGHDVRHVRPEQDIDGSAH